MSLLKSPRALLAAAVVLVLVALLLITRQATETRTVSAYFSRAVAVFKGTDVRILGVPVGKVTAVVPAGDSIRVDMEYDAEYAVPDDAQAAIITPTLTADRFVQLTPAYTGGAKLPDGAEISVKDTGTPIELDRIYRSLSDIAHALGPNGVNRNGTLDNVLGAGAKFLDGQGARANQTIIDMSRAVQTFGNRSGELFSTVRALEEFTGALADNDAAVDQFMGDLGQVSQQLAGEKQELAGALRNLAGVLGKVERFVRDNREMLTKDVEDLTTILGVMADEKKALEDVLNVAPSAMNNLAVAFDPKSETIGSRLNFQGNVQDLDGLLCTLVRAQGIPQQKLACQLFAQLLEPFEDKTQLPISAPQGPGAGSGGSGSGTAQVRYGSAEPARNLDQLLGGGA